MSTTQLDSGGRTERDWCVVTRRYEERQVVGGYEVTQDANVIVRAASMEITDGALVFRGIDGELSVVFGVGGWLDVARVAQP